METISLFPFFLVIFTSVLFSVLSRNMHIPWVVSLIFGGILLGPTVLDLFEPNETISFISEIGLIFLMFMAGLETKVEYSKNHRGKLFLLAFINGVIPFVVGFSITHYLGYDNIASFVMAIIFTSSSIAVVLPSLENYKLLKRPLGQSIIVSTVIQDVASLILLSALLQNIDPVTTLPLYIFYPLLILFMAIFRITSKRLRRYFDSLYADRADGFQFEFRSTLLILIGTVLIFEILGLHPIIAAFFSGVVLSDVITSRILKDKIRTIAYGVFIPTFFITVGLETDLTLFSNGFGTILVIAVIVGSSIVAKVVSGYYAGRAVGYKVDESLLFAVTSVPQLSTTLATAFTAQNLGLIDETLALSMVTLSVVTVLISPIFMNALSKRITRKDPVQQ